MSGNRPATTPENPHQREDTTVSERRSVTFKAVTFKASNIAAAAMTESSVFVHHIIRDVQIRANGLHVIMLINRFK